MKVILSRKGFDSENGRICSPIIDNRIMLSLPIPSKDKEKDYIKYEDLNCNGIGLDKILEDLGYHLKKPSEAAYCHLDPDLVRERRNEPVEGWCPAFGQINQSGGYLKNCGVAEGDLFLFFGNFRHVVKNKEGIYRYARRSKDVADVYYGKQIQVIWGYMQVEKVIDKPEEIKKFHWHPHACDKRLTELHNTIYLAKEKLTFAPEMPGGGIFDYNPKRVLTMEGRTKAIWKDEAAYRDDNLEKIKGKDSKRKSSIEKKTGIYYAGIWQEIVIKDNPTTETWAKSLF